MVVMVRGRASGVAPALLNLLLLLWLGWDRAFDVVIEVAIEGGGAADGGQVVQRGSLELVKSIFNGESLRPNRCQFPIVGRSATTKCFCHERLLARVHKSFHTWRKVIHDSFAEKCPIGRLSQLGLGLKRLLDFLGRLRIQEW